MCDFQICAPCAVQKQVSLWILGESLFSYSVLDKSDIYYSTNMRGYTDALCALQQISKDSNSQPKNPQTMQPVNQQNFLSLENIYNRYLSLVR